MIYIDITDFTLKDFIEEMTCNGEKGVNNLPSHKHDGSGGYAVKISINGRYIINDPKKNINGLQGCILYSTSKSINNAFYKLLTGNSEADIIIDWGSGGSQTLKVKRKENKVLFTTVKSRFEFDCSLDDEPVDFLQACEEVLRAVTYYKNICMEAANTLVPDDPLYFMVKLFEKEEKYTKDLYDDPHFDWLAYYSDKLKDKNKKIVVHVGKSSEESFLLQNHLLHDKGRDPTELHIIVRNYYEWLPLEEALEKYKKL